MYISDDPADVQDFGAECPDFGLWAECAVFGWDKVLRHSSHHSGITTGSMFSLHFQVKGQCVCDKVGKNGRAGNRNMALRFVDNVLTSTPRPRSALPHRRHLYTGAA